MSLDLEQWFNTKEGIAQVCSSLVGVNAVVKARHIATYDDGYSGKLTEFCLQGRYWLDTCGNCGLISLGNTSFAPIDFFPDILPVLTIPEFRAFLQSSIPDEAGRSLVVSHGSHSNPAPAGIACRFCHLKWDMGNCADYITERQEHEFSLSRYTGKPYRDFLEGMKGHSDALHVIAQDRALGTKFGWHTLKAVSEDYRIKADDRSMVTMWHFAHRQCDFANLLQKTERSFAKIFTDAGFAPSAIFLWPVENQYGSASWNGPWFKVRTVVGAFTIGWRKRVIVIDWTETGQDWSNLFGGEGVTLDSHLVHAWSEEKATEYLQRIREAFRPFDPI